MTRKLLVLALALLTCLFAFTAGADDKKPAANQDERKPLAAQGEKDAAKDGVSAVDALLDAEIFDLLSAECIGFPEPIFHFSKARTRAKVWGELAQRGNVRAMYLISNYFFYTPELRDKANLKKAAFEGMLKASEEKGMWFAQLGAANYYALGYGTEKDESKSFQLLSLAAKAETKTCSCHTGLPRPMNMALARSKMRPKPVRC